MPNVVASLKNLANKIIFPLSLQTISTAFFSFLFSPSQLKVLMIRMYLRWEFLRSRTSDKNLVNMIYLESDLWYRRVRKAGKDKEKQMSKDRVSTVALLYCDCRETLRNTKVCPPLKQRGSICYLVPITLGWRAVFQETDSSEALTVNSQSSWEMGTTAGYGILDPAPIPSTVSVYFRVPTV